MTYITSSYYPSEIYSIALEKAGRQGRKMFIVEIDFGDCVGYELHDSKPQIKNRGFIEMIIKPFDMFGKTLLDSDKRVINKVMRRIDDSSAWPINGKFNVTKRAIRRLQKWERDGGVFDCAYSYWKSLEQEISNIVNKEN